ncbi:MAG: PIN domain-containing protein [Isosphaeraceae bacterium]
MPLITALLDACVIYPAPLRDLFMYLAVEDVYRPRWTDFIHDEWIRSVLRDRPDLTRPQLERTRDLMNHHAQDSLVTGFEELIDELLLPDPNDRHVLAAAIHAGADLIVTFNLSDFPTHYLRSFGISARHPDVFCCDLINASLGQVLRAARLQRQSLRHPPKTVNEYLGTLQTVGLTKTAQLLAQFRDEI